MSNELGAGNPKSAAFSVVVVTMLSFILSVIIAVVILLCRDYVSYIYTGGEDVAAAVSKLTPLLAITLILNGIQPVLSGKLTHTRVKWMLPDRNKLMLERSIPFIC